MSRCVCSVCMCAEVHLVHRSHAYRAPMRMTWGGPFIVQFLDGCQAQLSKTDVYYAAPTTVMMPHGTAALRGQM